MKVYLVEFNEPYEYEMYGIFSTKEKAEQYIKTNWPDFSSLEVREYEIDCEVSQYETS